jgi:hypothetical protein
MVKIYEFIHQLGYLYRNLALEHVLIQGSGLCLVDFTEAQRTQLNRNPV